MPVQCVKFKRAKTLVTMKQPQHGELDDFQAPEVDMAAQAPEHYSCEAEGLQVRCPRAFIAI